MLCKVVFKSTVACIIYFYSMNISRMQVNCPNITAEPERMCLNHKSAFAVYGFKKLLMSPVFYFRMIIKPVLVQTIDKIIVAIKGLLNSKKYLELTVGTGKSVFFIKLFCFISGRFVATTINVYAVFPVAFSWSGSVSAKKMIRNKNS